MKTKLLLLQIRMRGTRQLSHAAVMHNGVVHEDEAAAVPAVGAVHGHDLSEGSGALDVLLGGDMTARWERVFVKTGLEFSLRGDGAYDYRYANTFM